MTGDEISIIFVTSYNRPEFALRPSHFSRACASRCSGDTTFIIFLTRLVRRRYSSLKFALTAPNRKR
jgi:hypothetical protein